jgi:hypothetical protein
LDESEEREEISEEQTRRLLKSGNKPMKLLSSILVLAIATTASSCSDDEVEVRSMC